MEPRGTLNTTSLLRNDGAANNGSEVLVAEGAQSTSTIGYERHDEPTRPVHPHLEYELLAETIVLLDDEKQQQDTTTNRRKRRKYLHDNIKLILSCICLVMSGVGTVISSKLQAIPMYNYPNFLNLFTNLLYIPICFAYIVPAAKWGNRGRGRSHRRRHRGRTSTVTRSTATEASPPSPGEAHPSSASAAAVDGDDPGPPHSDRSLHYYQFSKSIMSFWPPKRKLMRRFAIMGLLDCVSTTIQTFAAVYLPGPLLILLPQAAIPVSLAVNHSYEKQRQRKRKRRQRIRREAVEGSDDTVAAADASSRDEDSNTVLAWPHVLGATTVLLGIFIVLQPILVNMHAPDYCCEAQDQELNCHVCQLAQTQDACLSTASTSPSEEEPVPASSFLALTSRRRWLEDTDDEDTTACLWLPFAESSQEKEFLETVWSILLVLSTVPMALSALYKQRAMLSVMRTAAAATSTTTSSDNLDNKNERIRSRSPTTTRTGLPSTITNQTPQPSPPPTPPPALYVSGWIAVFQFLWSLFVAVPAALVASPTVWPWEVPRNLYDGLLCYAGYGIIETGCHPDVHCSSHHPALWVHVTVFCHVVYTISMMLVLKYSGRSNSVLLFLALTAIVPLGHLAFTLPFLPQASQTVVRTSDLAGLIVILAGLVLYRFSDPPPPADESGETSRKTQGGDNGHERDESLAWEDLFLIGTEDEGSDNDNHSSSLLCALLPIGNQTSYALSRQASRLTGDV